MLQTARFASMDTDCETEGTCVVFSGDSMECLRALGGWVDCCEMPAGVNLADYLRLILALGELDDTFGVFGASAEVQGAWEVLSQPVEDAWDWATEPVTSWFNGVTGRTTATTSTGEALGLVGTVEQFMMHNVAEWTLQVFGEGAVNSLFSVVTQHSGVDLATHLGSGTITEGVLQIGGGQAIVGTALSWIGTAYAIYTVADILVRTIWACDEESFQLGVNRQLHQCSFVGSYCATSVIGQCLERRMSYCCFNSPLSRIIQEQARPQLGMDWGDAESPECRGLSVNDLQRVDWDQVDLSEWIALLTETDLMPDLPSDFSADELTGEGRMVLDGIFPEARAPVEDRTRARTGQVDWYDIQRQAYDELWPGAVPACQPNC